MATYKRFEDVPIWRSAAQLYDQIDDLIDRGPPRMRHSFRDQLERATLSVSNNIAEGFEHGTTNELLAFLYLARGSAGEVRSMLLVASRRPYFSSFKSEIQISSNWPSPARASPGRGRTRCRIPTSPDQDTSTTTLARASGSAKREKRAKQNSRN